MAVTAADIKTRFQEFAKLDNAYITAVINESAALMNPTMWGSLYDIGLTWQTAHRIAIADKKAEYSSMTIGALKIDKKPSKFGDTTYGIEYSKMLRQINGGCITC